MKLLNDQKKVGVDIKSIDAKGKEGALPRPTAIRLGQLPGDQGTLSERAGKLGEQLEQLESIVYVWANTDIVNSMNAVKDDLAKPTTDVPTQAEETRIEEQLQAMIDNLRKKQASEKNERQQRQQQGQGGSGSVRPAEGPMPTETELRLLKALQHAVNKNTTVIDAEKNKDKPKLLSLGSRQGELRGLLDKMIQKASEGKIKLGAEPDNRDQLPEEAAKGAVEDNEFVKALLNQKPGDDESVRLHQAAPATAWPARASGCALNNDPGKTTQEIQKRIVNDMDDLINRPATSSRAAATTAAQPRRQRQQQQQQQQNHGQQQIAQQQQNRQQGQNAAQESVLRPGDKPQVDISQDIKAQIERWGRITAAPATRSSKASPKKSTPSTTSWSRTTSRASTKKATEQQR